VPKINSALLLLAMPFQNYLTFDKFLNALNTNKPVLPDENPDNRR
jgi:hypothetical protein